MCSKQCGYPAPRMRRPIRCLAIALKIRAKPADFADEQLFAAISAMWAENTRLGENDCVSRKLTKVTTMWWVGVENFG
ncbi:four-carbon acid sugar kinase family protein [Rhizobium leguminosarum]|uniref:hypothetical protein n=1 Tax=Rhizobium leguminosarum TaxID=384 RepID=UPI001C937409|nr:hypothetical protein [Rhizobium leguminosarum]MBY5325607.1 four-carbon acid sugar kinase family protein [Rhizobium leguminosarum]